MQSGRVSCMATRKSHYTDYSVFCIRARWVWPPTALVISSSEPSLPLSSGTGNWRSGRSSMHIWKHSWTETWVATFSVSCKYDISLRVTLRRLKWIKLGTFMNKMPFVAWYRDRDKLSFWTDVVVTRQTDFLGLGQTANFSRDEPNSNLGRLKLSWDRLLGQTSNLGRVEPINWIRSVINCLPKETKSHYHTNF